jgi:ubiquinone biosynthesis protein
MSLIEGTSFAALTPATLGGTDGKALGERGAEIWLEMVFRDGFVHSDPHPGNLFLLADSHLGIIDTGMVLRIDDETREQFIELIDAFVAGSATEFAEALLEICRHSPDADTAALADDLDSLISKYGNRSLRSIDMGQAISEFAALVHSHALLLPTRISALLQIVAELEGTSRLLDADFRVMPMVESYWQKLVAQRLSSQAIEQRLTSAARHLRREGRRLAATIEIVGEGLRSGNLNVRLTHAESDRVANRLVEGIITAALLLASSILWQARAAPVVGGVPILAAVGLVISVVLAVHLLFAIRRSEGV